MLQDQRVPRLKDHSALFGRAVTPGRPRRSGCLNRHAGVVHRQVGHDPDQLTGRRTPHLERGTGRRSTPLSVHIGEVANEQVRHRAATIAHGMGAECGLVRAMARSTAEVTVIEDDGIGGRRNARAGSGSARDGRPPFP